MTWLTLFSLAWAADCEASLTTVDLELHLESSVQHLAGYDIPSFVSSVEELEGLIPCVSEPLSRPTVAEIHRVYGLHAFGTRAPDVEVYFAAARAVQPGYSFPTSLVPRGSPIQIAYEAAADLETTRKTQAPPASGYLAFDGLRSLDRPTNRPTVVQLFDDDGTVRATAYVGSEGSLPDYEPFEGEVEARIESLPEGVPVVPSTRHRAPLLATTGVVVASSATLAVLALSAEGQYKDPNAVSDAELPALRARANGLGTAAWITGGAALALGATVALTW